MLRRIALVSAIVVVIAGAGWAQAPDGDTVPPTPDRLGEVVPGMTTPYQTNAFGTANFTAAVTAPHAFHSYSQGLGYSSWATGYIGAQTGDTHRFFDAPVYLPTGALINSVKTSIYDDDATGYVRVMLRYSECDGTAPCTITNILDVQSDTVGTPGYTVLQSTGEPVDGMTWRNYDQSNPTVDPGYLRVYFSAATSSLTLGPVLIWYQRQISPAPAVSSFPDVGTGYWAFQEIEALVSSGITTGYPDGTFKPTAAVTRAQMATFLSRALGLDYPDYVF